MEREKKKLTGKRRKKKHVCSLTCSSRYVARVANASHLENPKMHYGYVLCIMAQQEDKKLCWFY